MESEEESEDFEVVDAVEVIVEEGSEVEFEVGEDVEEESEGDFGVVEAVDEVVGGGESEEDFEAVDEEKSGGDFKSVDEAEE